MYCIYGKPCMHTDLFLLLFFGILKFTSCASSFSRFVTCVVFSGFGVFSIAFVIVLFGCFGCGTLKNHSCDVRSDIRNGGR